MKTSKFNDFKCNIKFLFKVYQNNYSRFIPKFAFYTCIFVLTLGFSFYSLYQFVNTYNLFFFFIYSIFNLFIIPLILEFYILRIFSFTSVLSTNDYNDIYVPNFNLALIRVIGAGKIFSLKLFYFFLFLIFDIFFVILYVYLVPFNNYLLLNHSINFLNLLNNKELIIQYFNAYKSSEGFYLTHSINYQHLYFYKAIILTIYIIDHLFILDFSKDSKLSKFKFIKKIFLIRFNVIKEYFFEHFIVILFALLAPLISFVYFYGLLRINNPNLSTYAIMFLSNVLYYFIILRFIPLFLFLNKAFQMRAFAKELIITYKKKNKNKKINKNINIKDNTLALLTKFNNSPITSKDYFISSLLYSMGDYNMLLLEVMISQDILDSFKIKNKERKNDDCTDLIEPY